MTITALDQEQVLTDQQAERIAQMRVFFGHKSVGANILDGIRETIAADPRIKLRLVASHDPATVSGPALIEAELGENEKPFSKSAAFATSLGNGMGPEGGAALFKYCYIDFNESTDVAAVFHDYQATVSAIDSRNAKIKIVHITVPLTTVEPATKAWVKSILGRRTARAENIKRNQFNRLLKQKYPANSIFDLASVEAIRPDGTQSYFMDGNEKIYTLADENTSDGGHLNERGRKIVAQRLLQFLASL